MQSNVNRPKSSLFPHILAALAFVGIPIAAACGGEVAPENGNASSDAGKKTQPTPTGSPTTPTPPPTALCDAKGLSELDGSTCAVSFTNTIFAKYMSASGTWKCSDGNCHGPSGPSGFSENAPTIDDSNALNAYTTLAQLQLNGEPYINTCSNDPNASSVYCNLKGTCAPTMPQSGAGVDSPGPTAPEIADLETWLKCGAPFN